MINFPGGGIYKYRKLKIAAAALVLGLAMSRTQTGAAVVDNLHTSLRALVENVKSIASETSSDVKAVNNTIGTSNTGAVPLEVNYRNSTVHGKLNYLEGRVESVFRSVSDGKKLLANSIADGLNVGPNNPVNKDAVYTFAELNSFLKNLETKKYEEGISFADGRVNKDSESYKEGYEKLTETYHLRETSFYINKRGSILLEKDNIELTSVTNAYGGSSDLLRYNADVRSVLSTTKILAVKQDGYANGDISRPISVRADIIIPEDFKSANAGFFGVRISSPSFWETFREGEYDGQNIYGDYHGHQVWPHAELQGVAPYNISQHPIRVTVLYLYREYSNPHAQG